MTHEECKIAVCKLLEESELNTIIDHLITSEGVGMMLDSPQIEDFVPRAILAVAIRKEYERFRLLSEIGVSIEENTASGWKSNHLTNNRIWKQQPIKR